MEAMPTSINMLKDNQGNVRFFGDLAIMRLWDVGANSEIVQESIQQNRFNLPDLE
jgi:hypothetical protein